MSEDAHTEWLPPQAPGAQPPRRWESQPETPEQPQTALQPPSPAPPVDWWRQDAHAAQPPVGWGHAAVVARPAGNAAALASLILGIAGIVLFFVGSFGLLFIVNMPCSILAWIFGVQGKRKIARGETTERRGMAQAGLALGIVGTVIGGLAIIAWALGFIFSDDLRQAFQDEWDKQQANR
jgi:hypothetical protein